MRVSAVGLMALTAASNLWRTVGNEVCRVLDRGSVAPADDVQLQDDECMFPEDSSAEESDQRRALGQTVRLDEASLLFGAGSKYYDLAAMHPNPVGVFKLWQVFLENVNPLTKIIHAPTLQQRILDASGDLGSVPKDIEALMFAIYSAALTSLDDDEVLQSFGESRDKLLALYRQGTQRALVNAGLLSTSSMMVLQALVVFIVSPSPRFYTSADFVDIWPRGVRSTHTLVAERHRRTNSAADRSPSRWLPPRAVDFRN